jgi:dipeptidyl aminopeptidase/acylaminoacyl peptidase
MFELLGTPGPDKRHVIFEDAGHWPLPQSRVTRETLAFFDKYLGSIN